MGRLKGLNPLRSVALKLSILTSLFVLGVIALMARSLLQGTEEGLQNEMRIRAEFFARSSREAIFPMVDPFILHFNVEEALKEKAVTYAAVVENSGKVLSHSRPEHIGETLRDPFSLQALRAAEPQLQRYTDKAGAVAYELSAPIRIGARRVGTARLGFNQSSIAQALRGQKRRIALVALAAVGLAVLGTSLIVRFITRPLPILAAAAREVGRGNFNVQVEWKSQDEVGVLARAFNEMTIANAVLFAAIDTEKEKLASIFHDTLEGMLLTNPAGRVLLINPSARGLLGCQARAIDTLEQALSRFTPKPSVGEILSSQARITPLELMRPEPKLLILSGVADRLGESGSPAGYLLIFHDATLEKRGATLSRNFLSLVSHKLRTPLTVALGFLEIIEQDPESLTPFQRQALAKIRGEDEKLKSLVEKLITYSTVQSPENIVLDRAETGLAEIVDSALKSLRRLLEEQKADVRWSAQDLQGLGRFSADPFLLKEAIVNLVENAVKFNRARSKEVSISARRDAESLEVAVSDNGPGIPSEEHPKLFKKFYQIDEHFTGQIPGMGLGLAFVKSVIEAHGGSVGMSSEPGRGSRFYFTLPARTSD